MQRVPRRKQNKLLREFFLSRIISWDYCSAKTLLENHWPRYFLHLKNLTILNAHAYTAESVDEIQLEKFVGQFTGKLISFSRLINYKLSK